MLCCLSVTLLWSNKPSSTAESKKEFGRQPFPLADRSQSINNGSNENESIDHCNGNRTKKQASSSVWNTMTAELTFAAFLWAMFKLRLGQYFKSPSNQQSRRVHNLEKQLTENVGNIWVMNVEWRRLSKISSALPSLGKKQFAFLTTQISCTKGKHSNVELCCCRQHR